jgi:hypothetical protein
MFVPLMMKAWIMAPRGRNWKGAGVDAIVLDVRGGVFDGVVGGKGVLKGMCKKEVVDKTSVLRGRR